MAELPLELLTPLFGVRQPSERLDGIHDGACGNHPLAPGSFSERHMRFGRADQTAITFLLVVQPAVRSGR